jgi:hypothetical protein
MKIKLYTTFFTLTMCNLILGLMLLTGLNAFGQTVQTITTTGTWTCPLGVTSVQVECWGAGGGGGAATGLTGRAGGGGGGGSYVKNTTLTVVPGTIYTVTIGAGGVAGTTSSATSFGTPGGISQFSGSGITPVTASGGTGGSGGTTPTPSGKGGVLGGVYAYTVTSGGLASYSTATTTVAVTGGGGSGAAGIVSTTSSVITYIVPLTQGAGYSSIPTVGITTTGTGTGATATALVNLNVNAGGATITLGGNGADGVTTVSSATGGAGGNGGAGGAGGALTGAVGANGALPGGGGGGGYSSASNFKGGTGGGGQIKLTYTPSATNYYYKGTASLANVANWGLNSDGTGLNPTNFTDNLQVFVIKNTAAVTTDAAWTVSAASSKIVLGDPTASAVTLTVDTLLAIIGPMDIAAASSGSNSLILKDPVFPTFGSLAATSEVHFQASMTITGSTTFGKVFIDSGDPTENINLSGTPHTIVTSLTVAANSVMQGSGTTANYNIVTGAAVIINGTLKTSRTGGLVNSNIAPSTSFGVLQFAGAENLTLGAASTIEYSKASSTTAQIITPRADYAHLTITDGAGPSANNKTLAAH